MRIILLLILMYSFNAQADELFPGMGVDLHVGWLHNFCSYSQCDPFSLEATAFVDVYRVDLKNIHIYTDIGITHYSTPFDGEFRGKSNWGVHFPRIGTRVYWDW